MKTALRRVAASALLALLAPPALAQTADEVIEKHLAASGGRDALAKLTSRIASGAIALTTPVGELPGTIEMSAERPNKSRTLIRLDLSAAGGGQLVSDQRFDGTTGYVIDTFNGNREITGSQLEAMRNASFPTPLLDYRAGGAAVELAGQEKAGAQDAYVIRLSPKTGPSVRLFIDAATFMLVKTIMTLDVPQLGGTVEQVIEFSDFRDVDGVKVPYTVRSVNPLQSIVATMHDVKHNVDIDDSSFAKPGQ